MKKIQYWLSVTLATPHSHLQYNHLLYSFSRSTVYVIQYCNITINHIKEYILYSLHSFRFTYRKLITI